MLFKTLFFQEMVQPNLNVLTEEHPWHVAIVIMCIYKDRQLHFSGGKPQHDITGRLCRTSRKQFYVYFWSFCFFLTELSVFQILMLGVNISNKKYLFEHLLNFRGPLTSWVLTSLDWIPGGTQDIAIVMRQCLIFI